jgi:hypothetical protein
MARWYHIRDGQQQGPYEDPDFRARLRQGEVRPKDYVWREGMAEWLQAHALPELLDDLPIPVAGTVAPLPGGPPLTLAYAVPAGATRQPLPQDEGPFLKVGKSYSILTGGFAIKNSRWVGATIVSPHAFYLLKRRHPLSFGGTFGVTRQSLFDPHRDTRTCGITELPESVRHVFEPRGRKMNIDVIVLPRETVRRVKAGWNNLVTIYCGNERFTISRSIFRGGAIRRFLREGGWPVGQEVTPTAEPIHGKGFGLNTEQREVRRSRAFQQQLTFAVVTVIIVAVFYFWRYFN